MLKETYQTGKVVDQLLLEMDHYDWASVGKIPTGNGNGLTDLNSFSEGARRIGLKSQGASLQFNAMQIIKHSRINPVGSILEFDAGTGSIGFAFPDVIALDNDPKNVKYLRCQGIKAIIGTIEGLPFPQNCFDYVVAFSPLIIRGSKGWEWASKESDTIDVRSDYKEEIVGRAIGIARKKVLIASVPIALDPPFIEKADTIVADPRHHYYYVIYSVN